MTHYRASEVLEFVPGEGTVLTVTYNPCPDEAAAHELELYADNTYDLYQRHEYLKERAAYYAARGRYDHAKMTSGLERYYADAARRYCREFGGSVRTTFPKNVRQWLAERDAEEIRREVLNW